MNMSFRINFPKLSISHLSGGMVVIFVAHSHFKGHFAPLLQYTIANG